MTMDAKTRQILKDARAAILWLANPQLRSGETRLPRTDIVEAIDALLNPPGSDAKEPECHCDWDVPGHSADCPLRLAGKV